MNPAVPQILSRAIAAVEKTAGGPDGRPARISELMLLERQVELACTWPSEERRRLINDWTKMLLQAARMAEQIGPFDTAQHMRALGVVSALLPYVRADLGEALELNRPTTTNETRP